MGEKTLYQTCVEVRDLTQETFGVTYQMDDVMSYCMAYRSIMELDTADDIAAIYAFAATIGLMCVIADGKEMGDNEVIKTVDRVIFIGRNGNNKTKTALVEGEKIYKHMLEGEDMSALYGNKRGVAMMIASFNLMGFFREIKVDDDKSPQIIDHLNNYLALVRTIQAIENLGNEFSVSLDKTIKVKEMVEDGLRMIVNESVVILAYAETVMPNKRTSIFDYTQVTSMIQDALRQKDESYKEKPEVPIMGTAGLVVLLGALDESLVYRFLCAVDSVQTYVGDAIAYLLTGDEDADWRSLEPDVVKNALNKFAGAVSKETGESFTLDMTQKMRKGIEPEKAIDRDKDQDQDARQKDLDAIKKDIKRGGKTSKS